VQWTAAYQPFGYTSTGVGTIVQNLRLPGQEWDLETGLYHNGFRDYQPGLGRYIQSDPIGLAGGINTYDYVVNNPVSNIDPHGLYDIVLSGGYHVPFAPGIAVGADSIFYNALFEHLEQLLGYRRSNIGCGVWWIR